MPADFQVFGHLLRLWTRYPRVKLNEYVDVDEWLFMTSNELDGRDKGFVSHVYLAWLRSHHPDHLVPPEGVSDLPWNEFTRRAWKVLSDVHASDRVEQLEEPKELEQLQMLKVNEKLQSENAKFLNFHNKVMDMLLNAARRTTEEGDPDWR